MNTEFTNEFINYSLPDIAINMSMTHIFNFVGVISNTHFHNEMEFLYINRGCLVCHTELDDYTATEGDIIFINSRTPHSTEKLEPSTQTLIAQFLNPSPIASFTNAKYFNRYLSKSRLGSCIFKKGEKDTEFIKNILFSTYNESITKELAYEHYMVANIYTLIAFLYRKQLLPDERELFSNKNTHNIFPVIEYIEQNYEKHITLADISNTVGFNESYLCRIFKKATGGSIMDYLNFVRVCKAESLLKTKASILDISVQTGFSSQTYFNKIFKKYNYRSPSEYRKLISHF